MDQSEVSRIILGTGNYNAVKEGNTVSITGDGGNAWGYYGPAYKKLAPRLVTYANYIKKYDKLLSLKQNYLELQKYVELRKEIEDEYIVSYYETRLKYFNIEELLTTLKSTFGDNIILLCHEPIDEFCHRRLVADYIELETGVYIPEVKVTDEGIVKKLTPIRYKNRLKRVINDRR